MAVNFKGKKGPSWAKTGKAAKKAVEQEEAKAEQKQAMAGKMKRFWMPPNTDKRITFLDGNLDDEGVLDCLVFFEHQVYMNGSYRNWFICTQDSEPCPVCENGDEPYLAGVFTIIDHDEYEYNGKTYKDQKRLFVAKRSTLKLLQKIAAKRGGLAGATFEVSRSGEKVAAVGDMFDFEGKRNLKELKKEFPDVEDWSVADYEEEIVYRDADELRSIGFGNQSVIGKESGLDEGDDGSLDDEL